MKLPTFNRLFATKPSRCSDRGESTFLDGLVKLDTQTCLAKHWNAHAHSPGEPIFVPDPRSKEEDDGVLLSVVLDGMKGTSHLPILDAKTFSEIGKATMDIAFLFGFHGTYVPGRWEFKKLISLWKVPDRFDDYSVDDTFRAAHRSWSYQFFSLPRFAPLQLWKSRGYGRRG
jgi:hypothetical protein